MITIVTSTRPSDKPGEAQSRISKCVLEFFTILTLSGVLSRIDVRVLIGKHRLINVTREHPELKLVICHQTLVLQHDNMQGTGLSELTSMTFAKSAVFVEC